MPQSGDSPVPLLVRHRRTGGTHVAVRRVAGVHRAGGLAGPTRRYTVIVVMLATMSSLPIIAAIGTGSANVGDSVDASGTTPFIAPPSEGPAVVPPPPPPTVPVEVPVPAGVAEQLRAVAPKREPRQRRPVRKLKRPVRATESAPAPAPPRPSRPVKPTKPSPSPSPSPSPTPSPRPPLIPRPPLPSAPYVPLPPSASHSVPPTGLPTCWPDLDACLSDPSASVRP
ncbi:hypothetical protein ACTMTJ_11365 [Phytohabitans sp. LJ34]|uniref:hypothetical protein n=1 Tax=Phytohabitans sp. LJ34 TaxID=3452217 RepID=UPI003F8CEFF4